MLQPQGSAQPLDVGADTSGTIAAVHQRQSDVPAKGMTKSTMHYTRSWQPQQQGQLAPMTSYVSSVLPQLQPQLLLQEIEKAVEKAVVTAVTKLARSGDQHMSASAAVALAEDMMAAQQQQDAAAAAAVDQKSAYAPQLLSADAHARAACSTTSAGPAIYWTNNCTTLAEAAQADLHTAWQTQQQQRQQKLLMLPLSPVQPSYGSSGTCSGMAAASAAAAPCGSSCPKTPVATAGPAPPAPTASPRRPAPVRRRTSGCLPQATPGGSVAVAATAPATPNVVGRVLDSLWATGHGAALVGCPQHLLPSVTGDISIFPTGNGRGLISSSGNSSCCSRLSDCSSGFASSRSSNDGGGSASSNSSSPLAMLMPLLKACDSCGQLQPLAPAAAATAAVSPGQQLLLHSLQLHPPSAASRQPSPPQEAPRAAGGSPGKTSPRLKFICSAAPASPFAAAPAGAAASPAAGRASSRFAPVAPPRTQLQRGACGGAELRANVGRYRRHSVSSAGLAGDGSIGASVSVHGGADCARFRWAGFSLDGGGSGGGMMPVLPAGGACDGGGAAAFAAAMAAVHLGAPGMAGH